ncbi:class I SAM-dependent methyltransferase [Metabacillus sp. RGM 3146]|uniref:class I SAM-dependent methyltransferase n=1 Tax=Metabacillus sp. RGM 3146 TaxID=3401092 RepID=UPI003B9A8187
MIDVGCGHGGYLQKLSAVYPDLQMLGIEVNEEVAKEAGSRCRECTNIRVECADAIEYHPKEKTDYVMMNNLLHYLSPEMRKALFIQMTQWLGKEGIISIITPIQNSRHGKQFSSAFNSFFAAFDNLYPVPEKSDLKEIADLIHMKMTDFRPVVKEGSWYFLTMKRK